MQRALSPLNRAYIRPTKALLFSSTSPGSGFLQRPRVLSARTACSPPSSRFTSLRQFSSTPAAPSHSHNLSNTDSSGCISCSYQRSITRYFGGTATTTDKNRRTNTTMCAPPSASAAGSAEPVQDSRLSRDILPKHYDLGIKTDLQKLTFQGKVEIELDIVNNPSSTNTITLNAAPQLQILNAVLSSSSLKTSSSILASEITFDKKLERITVHFHDDAVKLQAGQSYKLGLRFQGELEGSMMGYYKSAYETAEGKTAYYSLTQFEATAARRAFPCWDEPDIKATFTLTLLSKKGLTVLANMPKEHTFADVGEVALFPEEVEAADEENRKDALLGAPEARARGTKSRSPSPSHFPRGHAEIASDASEGDGWVATVFQKTPIMSTYLVAWANGDFRHLESSYTSPLSGRKVPLRIYTTPEHIHQAQFALDVKAKVLPVYEKLFDIEYPLPKLDTLVASDFDAGAMENWGLITGRTIVYLFDEKNGSVDARKLTATVQSHEVAHQWFGNITTMVWWDALWLNEAFATLMGEVISIHAVWPEWNPHSSFLNAHLRRALELDSQRSSHPIEQPCPDTEMIAQIFDAISYSKGASVLRMLSNMIGEETFLKGVSIYLKKHLYSNAKTVDLWAGISEACGLDVAKIMSNWTLKVGFPIISVEETAEGLKVKQNRFLSTGDPKPEEDETLWYVPLELKTVDKSGKASIDHKAVLEGRETLLPLEDAANTVYKLNAETAGVYRVLYSPERLGKLGDEASKKGSVLSLNDRIGLVQDAFVLSKSGYGKTSGALNLVSKLASEEEYLVWKEIATGLADINDTWWDQDEKTRNALDKLNRDTFAPIVEKLGWEIGAKDSTDTRELRTLAISAAARSGDEAAIKEVQRRFALFTEQNDQASVPGDLLDLIFANAVRYGGVDEYEKCLAIYRKPSSPQHKQAAMRAFCCTRDEKLIDRTIQFMNSDEVKMQDMMYFFGGLGANRMSRRKIWAELQRNLEHLAVKFKGNFSLGRLVQYSFSGLNTKEDEEAIVKFFSDKDTKDYVQSLKQGLDSVRAKTAWLERDASDVAEWLQENGYSS